MWTCMAESSQMPTVLRKNSALAFGAGRVILPWPLRSLSTALSWLEPHKAGFGVDSLFFDWKHFNLELVCHFWGFYTICRRVPGRNLYWLVQLLTKQLMTRVKSPGFSYLGRRYLNLGSNSSCFLAVLISYRPLFLSFSSFVYLSIMWSFGSWMSKKHCHRAETCSNWLFTTISRSSGRIHFCGSHRHVPHKQEKKMKHACNLNEVQGSFQKFSADGLDRAMYFPCIQGYPQSQCMCLQSKSLRRFSYSRICGDVPVVWTTHTEFTAKKWGSNMLLHTQFWKPSAAQVVLKQHHSMQNLVYNYCPIPNFVNHVVESCWGWICG